ncbi:MAG TPA: PEP-CTERM sorting domain-containing protein [Planctomycetes bacterium]|nr:PEP-CTERM sorting domain-containing protein [Planctomycetota bacterium]
MKTLIAGTVLLVLTVPSLPSQTRTSGVRKATTLYGHNNPGRPTPEPSSVLTLAVLGAALAGMSFFAFKKRKR